MALDRLRRFVAAVGELADRYPTSSYLVKLGRQAHVVEADLAAADEPVRRIFARILAADVECPKCGAVVTFGLHRTEKRGGRRRASQWYWDHTTSRLTCPGCQAVYVPALVLYRPSHGRAATPADQLPDARQRAAMLAPTEGYALPDRLASPVTRTHLVPPAGCCCPPSLDGWRAGDDPTCPVHGSQGSRRGGPRD